MNTTTKAAPRQLTRTEMVDDVKRALIALLLGQRTWESKDLQRTMTVAQVADRLTGTA